MCRLGRLTSQKGARLGNHPPARVLLPVRKNQNCVIEAFYFLSSIKCEDFIKGNQGKGVGFISDTQDHNYKTVDKERRKKIVSPNHKNKTMSLDYKAYGTLMRKFWLSGGVWKQKVLIRLYCVICLL